MIAAPRHTTVPPILAAALIACASLTGMARAPDPVIHARSLLRQYDASRMSDESYSSDLAEGLCRAADSLEATGSDSLAWRCRRVAAGMLSRAARSKEAVRQNELALAAAIRTKLDPLVLKSRIGLSDSYRMLGLVEEAIAVAREAIPAAARSGDSVGVAEAANSVAASCLAIGRMNEAGDSYARALGAARAVDDMPNIIEAVSGLTQYLHFCERNREALVYADSAVALADAKGSPHRRAVAYNIRAIVRSAVGRPREALLDADSACVIDRRSRNLRHLVQSRLTKARIFLQTGDRDSCIAEADRLLAASTLREEDFRTRVLSLKGVALIEGGRFAEAESLLLETVERTEARRRELREGQSRAAAFYYGGVAYSTLSRCYLEQGRTRDAWRALQAGRAGALRARVRRSADLDTTDRIDRLQRRLSAERAAILQYNDPARNPPMVFVLTGDSLGAIRLPEPHGAAAARTAMQLLSGGAADGLCRAALVPVSEDLLAGVLLSIPPGVERLFIAPPSHLVGLPFEELPLPGADGEILLDRFAVSYIPTAELLLDLIDRPARDDGMIVVADPEPLPDRDRGLLPGTREEARRVAVRGARILAGKSATRGRLLDLLAEHPPATIHFATHATVDAVNPESSSLLLAGDDGTVTAADVESLPFSVDLVTLSGCRTSGGFTYLGEGTLGLTRSFLIAGARSVVSSLWEVEDRAATRIMELFYAGLREGLPRDQALRWAKLSARREDLPMRDRAAFVLTGAGHLPVSSIAGKGARGSPIPYILPAIAGILALVVAIRRLRRAMGENPRGRSRT